MTYTALAFDAQSPAGRGRFSKVPEVTVLFRIVARGRLGWGSGSVSLVLAILSALFVGSLARTRADVEPRAGTPGAER